MISVRNSLAAMAAACMLFVAAPAQAGDYGIYFAPKLNLGIQSLSSFLTRGTNGGTTGLDGGHDWNVGIGAAAGFDFYAQYAIPARVELELMHVTDARDHGTYHAAVTGQSFSYEQRNSANTLFINTYFDLHNTTDFVPYIGIGLGTAWVSSKGQLQGAGLSSNTENNLAWNVGAGLAWNINYNMSLDFGYRYANLGKARTGTNPLGHLESKMALHQFMGGVRYTF